MASQRLVLGKHFNDANEIPFVLVCSFSFVPFPMTVEIKKRIIPKCRTYSEVVDTIRNGIAAKFDAQCVLPSVFDSVVNAECAIAIIVNINVHITVVNYAHIKKKNELQLSPSRRQEKIHMFQLLPAGCPADATSNSTIASILGVDRNAIFFAN